MKRIFSTGASSGIGLAIARALIEQGDEVWGTARRTERIPTLPRMHAVALDLADRESLGEIFRSAWREAGHFDVVINNAGSGYFGPAEALAPEDLAPALPSAGVWPDRTDASRARGHETREARARDQCQLARVAVAGAIHGDLQRGQGRARRPTPCRSSSNSRTATSGWSICSRPTSTPASTTRSSRAKQNDARVEQTWAAVDRNMKGAPPPELVARAVLKLIEQSNPPPRVTVGDFFQAGVAPLIFRFLPQRVRLWGLKKYYGI